MSIGNQKEKGLLLIFFTLVLFISLLFLNAGVFNSFLLCLIFYTFIIGLFDNRLGFFLFLLLRPALGLFINDPVMVIGKFAPNAVSLTGGLALIFSAIVLTKHRSNLKKIPLLFPWLVFLFITTLSIFFSIAPGESAEEVLRLLSIFSLFLIGFVLIKNNRDLVTLIKVIIFSGLVPSLVALFQFFAKINLSSPEEDATNRVFGTFSHPNLLAFYLIIPLSMCLLVFLVSDKKKVSISLYGILGAILALTLGLTYTRGAWIGFLIVILALGIFKYRRFLIIAAIIITTSYFSSSEIQSRVGNTVRIDPYGSIQFRLDLWKDSFGYFRQKPLLGHGTDTATNLIAKKRPEQGSVHPHNDYLKIILENGLIGLFAYLLLYLELFKKLHNLWKNEKRPKIKIMFFLALSLALSLSVVSLGDNILKNTSLMWSFWALIGGLLALGAGKLAKKKA